MTALYLIAAVGGTFVAGACWAQQDTLGLVVLGTLAVINGWAFLGEYRS